MAWKTDNNDRITKPRMIDNQRLLYAEAKAIELCAELNGMRANGHDEYEQLQYAIAKIDSVLHEYECGLEEIVRLMQENTIKAINSALPSLMLVKDKNEGGKDKH